MQRNTTHPALSLTILLSGAITAAVHAGNRYELIALPDLGGEVNDTRAIVHATDDTGRAVGVVATAEGGAQAALWERIDGAWSLTVLPSLGNGDWDIVYAINSAGAISGVSTLADMVTLRAVRWHQIDGAWTVSELDSLGGTESSVVGENAAGVMAGGSEDANGLRHAVLWQDGEMLDIVSIEGVHTTAYQVNNLVQVAGGGYWGPGAFLWLPEPAYDMPAGYNALPTLGGNTFDAAWGINDRGLVCGHSEAPDGISHPVLWVNGELIDLTPGADKPGFASALDVNERNQVVGTRRGDLGEERAFLWEDGAMMDLTDLLVGAPGWLVDWGYAINEAGWIGGAASFEGAPSQAVLLTPVCPGENGDLNGDGVVDFADLLILLNNWD